MKIFKYLFFTLFYLALCLPLTLEAEIIRIKDLGEAETKFTTLNENSLVVFDVDYTLILPDDAILRPCGRPLIQKLIKKFLINSSSRQTKKFSEDYLRSQIILQAKNSLLDKRFLTIIKVLQNKHIPTIALTAAPAGKFGAIDNMANWRVGVLNKLGIDFTMAFPENPFLVLPKRTNNKFPPIFNSGILFSCNHSKGEVLKKFLNAIKWYPTKLIFFDDKFEYIESVANVMEEMRIDFTGFHYIAAEMLPNNLDVEIAKFQFDYLSQHAKWLSDEKAKEMMKCR